MRDGIEIHYDDQRSYLELACEPDAFEPYRKLVREQLSGVPEIDIETIVELNVIDTDRYVARRAGLGNRLLGWALPMVVL